MKLESFSVILSDCTSKYNKIKKEDYLPEGQFPIIDQGQKFVGGYTDDGELITAIEKELIIFGDHTKILKFIDFPIAIGADGVKVLHVNKEKADPKYIYYFLKSVKLTDAGYSRHFKYLKEIKIPVPESIDDQIKIARLLNHVETLIIQRKESILLLDKLLQSKFFEMFGDNVHNLKGWEKVPLSKFGLIITGNTPPRSDSQNYSKDFIEWIKTDNITEESIIITRSKEYLSEKGLKKSRFIEKGALLVACIAGSIDSVGRASLTDRKVSFNQQINAIQPNEEINPYYLYWLFKNSRTYVQNHATKGMKKILTKGLFEKILMIKPPVELQKQFGTLVEKVEAVKSEYQTSLKELENMYGVLSQKAFKGELK
jgi:type I restriction enzyme S subunit